MEILYISHCVPWPPDKGDRLRAFHSVSGLLGRHPVHLACLARNANEAAAISELRGRLASVRIEVLDFRWSCLRGLLEFARGGSFTAGFHHVPALQDHVRRLIASHPIGAVVLLSSATALYAPDGIPFIADWGDVDSEKRLQYARVRFPGLAQRLEGLRLRQVERDYALRSRRTFLITPNELALFRQIAPNAPLGCAGNGVDADMFDPGLAPAVPAGLAGRKYLVFVGVLNYFPNTEGICRFAREVFPELRRRDPELELVIVGRNPPRGVIELGKGEGITVTGAVDDVRPYLAAARAVVTPLRIARGIQNKVLEALAMGKPVLASEEVCRTFLPDLPAGVVCCASPDDYARAAARLPDTAEVDWTIVRAARSRFTWSGNLAPLMAELDSIEREAAGRG